MKTYLNAIKNLANKFSTEGDDLYNEIANNLFFNKYSFDNGMVVEQVTDAPQYAIVNYRGNSNTVDSIDFGHGMSKEDSNGKITTAHAMKVEEGAGSSATVVYLKGQNGFDFGYIGGGNVEHKEGDSKLVSTITSNNGSKFTGNGVLTGYSYGAYDKLTVTDIITEGDKYVAEVNLYSTDEGERLKVKTGEYTAIHVPILQDKFYVEIQPETVDGKTSYTIPNGAKLYLDADCTSTCTTGAKVWDFDGGTEKEEMYSLDDWKYMTYFRYTSDDALGNLYTVELREIPGKETNRGKITQVVTKSLSGEEIVALANDMKEYLLLHIDDAQNLFDLTKAKEIMENTGKEPFDSKPKTETYFNDLENAIYDYLDALFDGRKDDGSYKDGYEKLYDNLFANADKIGDIAGIMKLLNDDDKELVAGNELFNSIKKQGLLEDLFNQFGEPKMTWIDTNDQNQDGVAKAEWYMNIFNKMKEGYKVLEDGLASSNDWIQYALESGLVNIAQVDRAKNWVGTTHKNVKEITEVVDDAAVARAEAEYNKAMNDIENKDKRLDMELKNIDTEHNALQQEYESIKSVISKNVERTFKIFS